MLLIAADTDPLFLRFVERSLAGTEFEPRVADGGEDAWTWAQEAAPPVLILYAWGISVAGDASPYSRLRRMRAPRERYLIATLGPGEGPALVQAVEAGADDVLVKPLSPDLLLARLRLAARRCAAPERMVGSPREAVREAIAHPVGGEVVVRRGDHVGRIYVSDGKIAWASVAGETVRLRGLVQSAGVELDDEAAAAVLEESRRLRVHFADVLVRWGYVDESGARECVRAAVAEQLGELLSMQDATALFLPRAGHYGSRMSFTMGEVAAPSIAPHAHGADAAAVVRLPRDRIARRGAIVDRAMALEGAVGAAVLDRKTGEAWHCAGEAIDGELAWSLLGTLVALGPGAEDAIAVREGAAFLARNIDEATALVVAFALMRTTLGLARMSMKASVATAQISGEEEKEHHG
jgi:CheY-like chemotaxis protein